MTENEKIKIDFLLALAEPEYARVDYLKDKQKKSIYSKEVYLKMLAEIQAFYGSKIKNETAKINRLGNNVTDFKLPLLSETNGQMTGHLGNKKLDELGALIIELSKEFNLKWDDSFYENISDSAKGAIKDIMDSEESNEYKLSQLKALREKFQKGLLQPIEQVYEQSKNAKFLVDVSQAEIADYLILKEIIKLEKSDKKPNVPIDIQPIHWLKGEGSLRQFLDTIKSAGLIENRGADEIIQEHFLVDGKKPTKEPQPINWLKSKVLLAYLIQELSTKPEMHEPFIKPDKKWQLTELHFTVKGKEIGRSLVNDIKQSRFPNGCEEIDKTLKRLTKH